MVNFNEPKRNINTNGETTNQAEGKAFDPQSPELSLYKVVINNLLENTYYETGEESLEKVVERFNAVKSEDPEFALQLAEYSRNEMYLRDVSQLLLVLAANDPQTASYVKKYAPLIISRADELCTVMAIQTDLFGKPMPSELLDGVEKSLYNFDRYQYAKYFQSHKDWDFRDVLNVVKPNPETSERAQASDTNYVDIFRKIIRGGLDDYPEIDSLEPPETWEVVISEKGNTKEAWLEVKDRMGLFGLIRNARNMRQAGLTGEEIFGEVDTEWIENAPLYPFRYYQSYKALRKVQLLDQYSSEFLQDAIDISTQSVPDFLDETVVGVDLSGSMGTPLSNRSNINLKEIAALFGAVSAKKGGEAWGFGNDAEKAPIDPTMPAIALQDRILNMNVGNSTNGWKVIRNLRVQDRRVDRIILFTDEQIWDSTGWGVNNADKAVKPELDKYRQNYPDVALYMVDLASYGTLQTPEGYDKVFNISGWNDNIFDFIDHAEEPNEIIKEIKGR